MKNTTLIGVYGTLKKGYGNHRLLENSKLIRGQFLQNVALASGFMIPYAFRKDGYETFVEVYEVDDFTLAQVDRLEGHPNFYKRELVDGIWVYLNERDAYCYPIVENGIWDNPYKNYVEED